MKKIISIYLLVLLSACSDKTDKIEVETISFPTTKFDYVRRTDNNYRVVLKDKKQGVINDKGKLILPIEYDAINITDNEIIYKKGDNMGVISLDGKKELTDKAPYILPSGKNYIIGNKLGKYGLVNKNKKQILSIEYDNIQLLKNNIYRVSKNGKYGLVDENGKEIVAPKYSYIKDFSNGMALVISSEGKGGFIDEKGNEVVKTIYKYTEDYKGEITFIYDDDKFGVINKKGEYIKPLQKERINIVADTLYSEKENDKFYLKGIDGKKITEIGYDSIGEEKDGIISVKNGNKFGYINKKGEVVIPLIYTEIGEQIDGTILAKDEKTGKFGVIDYRNNFIVKPEYTYIIARTKDFFIVGNDEFKEGIINKKGEIILPLTYTNLSFKYINLALGQDEKGEYKYIFLKENSSKPLNVKAEEVMEFDNDEIVVKTKSEIKIYKVK